MRWTAVKRTLNCTCVQRIENAHETQIRRTNTRASVYWSPTIQDPRGRGCKSLVHNLIGVPVKQELYDCPDFVLLLNVERLIFVAKSSSRVWKDLDSFEQKKYSEQLLIWSILHVRLNKNYNAQTVTYIL